MIIYNVYANSAQIKAIYREAINLERQGWFVLANYIPGYQIPPEIEGYIPDIYAVKGKLTRIILIDYINSVGPEKKAVLKKYISGYRDMFLNIYLVNIAGCRISTDQ
jgi:hypothetical protein